MPPEPLGWVPTFPCCLRVVSRVSLQHMRWRAQHWLLSGAWPRLWERGEIDGPRRDRPGRCRDPLDVLWWNLESDHFAPLRWVSPALGIPEQWSLRHLDWLSAPVDRWSRQGHVVVQQSNNYTIPFHFSLPTSLESNSNLLEPHATTAPEPNSNHRMWPQRNASQRGFSLALAKRHRKSPQSPQP